MRVYALSDHRRRCVRVYVEIEERPDGSATFLARGLDGREEIAQVDPCTEAPFYLSIAMPLAKHIATALSVGPLVDEMVTLESFRDFVTLVERAWVPAS